MSTWRRLHAALSQRYLARKRPEMIRPIRCAIHRCQSSTSAFPGAPRTATPWNDSTDASAWNDPNDDDDEQRGLETTVWYDTIHQLVQQLQEQGYERASATTLIRNETVTVTTQEWVLQQAASNASLRALLVSTAHGLHHVCDCLHYDFLWQALDENESDLDEATRVMRHHGFLPHTSPADHQ